MGKRDKFLKDLENKLENYKFKNKVIKKYDSLISKKVNNGVKIDAVINELGSSAAVAEKEIKNNSLINRILRFLEKTLKKIEIWFKKVINKIYKGTKNKNLEVGNSLEKVKKSTWLLLLEILFFITACYIAVMFMVSVLTVLDGVKIYGIVLVLFSVLLINLMVLDILNKRRNKIVYNIRKYFLCLIALIISISFGIAYTTYSYFKIDFVNTPNDKYTLTYKELTYKLSKNQKTDIYFNSFYKPSYSIIYDEDLKNKVKIVIKYNEAFYDLNSQNDEGDIYISLASDERNLVSMYLNNLKDNKIYNEKELSRYLIKIYINEADKKRLTIHN